MIKTQSPGIVIVGNLFTYPEASAAAANARVYAYARGFARNMARVAVITMSNAYGYTGVTEDKGFDYYVALQQKERRNNFLVRKFFSIKRYLNLIGFLRYFLAVSGSIDAIILYSRSPFLMIYIKILAKYFSASALLEVTEHPLNDFKELSLWKLFFPWSIYPLFNGFLCISRSLQDYCYKYTWGNVKVLLIPPLVDFETYISNNPRPLEEDYLFYSGSLTIHRDGLDILIKAFQRICQEFTSLKLVLGGKWYDDKTKEEIHTLVKTLDLDEKVIFLDFLPKEEILAYAFNAKILCIPRRWNLQTNSAFPIKLAEYLATGKPVLTTRVGDIPDYIVDGVNGYLADPGSEVSLYEKILVILKNYDEALMVGLAGEKIALNKFSNTNETLKIMNLVSELK